MGLLIRTQVPAENVEADGEAAAHAVVNRSQAEQEKPLASARGSAKMEKPRTTCSLEEAAGVARSGPSPCSTGSCQRTSASF